MLGAFLRIAKQFLFQRDIFLGRVAAPARTRERAQHDLVALRAYENFRRRADDLFAAQIDEIHVRRRIQGAQCAVDVERARAERHRQTLTDLHLEHVAGIDVFLGPGDRGEVIVLRETRYEMRFVDRVEGDEVRVRSAGRTQPVHESVEPPLRPRIRARLGRIDIDDQV